MKISTRGRYGLHALIEIAAYDYSLNANNKLEKNENNHCINIKTIAEKHGLSTNYLDLLLSPLKKAGIVKSVRGAQGGYKLYKDPASIKVSEVLLLLEGTLYPAECVDKDHKSNCGTDDCGECVTRSLWSKMYDSTMSVLNINLDELVIEYLQNQNNKS